MATYLYNRGEKRAGSEPINDTFEALQNLPPSERGMILKKIDMLDKGYKLNTIADKPIDSNLRELKFRGGAKGEWRIYYCQSDNDTILLCVSTSKDHGEQGKAIEAAKQYRDDAMARIRYMKQEAMRQELKHARAVMDGAPAVDVSGPVSELFRAANPGKISITIRRQ